MSSQQLLHILSALLTLTLRIIASPVSPPSNQVDPLSECPPLPYQLGDPRFGDKDGDVNGRPGGNNSLDRQYCTVDWVAVGGTGISNVNLATASADFWTYSDQTSSSTDVKALDPPETFLVQYTKGMPDKSGPIYEGRAMIGPQDLGRSKIGLVTPAPNDTVRPWNGIMGLSFPAKGAAGRADDTSVVDKVPFFAVSTTTEAGIVKQVWNFDHINQQKIDRNSLEGAPVEYLDGRHLVGWGVKIASIATNGQTFPVPDSWTFVVDTGSPEVGLPEDMVSAIYTKYGTEGTAWRKDSDGVYSVSKAVGEDWQDVKFTLPNGGQWTLFGKHLPDLSDAPYEYPLESGRFWYWGTVQSRPFKDGVGIASLGKPFLIGNLVVFDSQHTRVENGNFVGCAVVRVAPLL